jgi:hypothetical protein
MIPNGAAAEPQSESGTRRFGSEKRFEQPGHGFRWNPATTVLSFTIWMPVLDTAHAVTIP